jgi:hypothetical protein
MTCSVCLGCTARDENLLLTTLLLLLLLLMNAAVVKGATNNTNLILAHVKLRRVTGATSTMVKFQLDHEVSLQNKDGDQFRKEVGSPSSGRENGGSFVSSHFSFVGPRFKTEYVSEWCVGPALLTPDLLSFSFSSSCCPSSSGPSSELVRRRVDSLLFSEKSSERSGESP